MTAATFAGTVSTLMFVASMLPMLVRAARTKDMTSYSRSHLALSSAGSLVHSIYVVSLPVGPTWRSLDRVGLRREPFGPTVDRWHVSNVPHQHLTNCDQVEPVQHPVLWRITRRPAAEVSERPATLHAATAGVNMTAGCIPYVATSATERRSWFHWTLM
jgi:hypothetical protein